MHPVGQTTLGDDGTKAIVHGGGGTCQHEEHHAKRSGKGVYAAIIQVGSEAFLQLASGKSFSGLFSTVSNHWEAVGLGASRSTGEPEGGRGPEGLQSVHIDRRPSIDQQVSRL
jgi:hypothetical protein